MSLRWCFALERSSVRGTPQAVRPAGLLWALPAPFDEVLRVKTQKVHELTIRGLHLTAYQNEEKRR